MGRIGDIDRRACRAHGKEHFSAAAMADGYERVYHALRGRDRLRAVT
ncbi:MAG: hypothetical protein M3176_08760 [Chloroflexota bacterium]|nr:hypothetical protein [Chloroflexota bacterium]